MKEKRVATTQLEGSMFFAFFCGIFIVAFLDDLDPTTDIFFISMAGSSIPLALFIISHKRYSWVFAFIYFSYMFVITLICSFQQAFGVTIVSLVLFSFFIIAIFSENERIIHKVFI